MKKLFSMMFLLGVLLYCQEGRAQSSSKEETPRGYDDVVRDMGRRGQAGMDSWYRQATKGAGAVSEVVDQVDLSKVVTTGKVVLAGDTIDFKTPAQQLYDSIIKLVPKEIK